MENETEPRDDIRIIRVSELHQLGNTLSTCLDALHRSPRTNSRENAIYEISEAHDLLGSIGLGEERKPPADIAGRLETQTRIL